MGSKRILGLWFHDDNERQRFEGIVEKTLKEIRSPPGEPQIEPQPQVIPRSQGEMENQSQPVPKHAAPPETVTVSTSSVKSALQALANDDAFVGIAMQKLKENASG